MEITCPKIANVENCTKSLKITHFGVQWLFYYLPDFAIFEKKNLSNQLTLQTINPQFLRDVAHFAP